MRRNVLLSWRHLIHQTRFPELIKIVDIQPGEVVVDVGCSRGHFVYEFRKRGACAFGVDIDEKQFTYNDKNLLFVNGSIFELPMKNDSIDKVFISEVLISLPRDPVVALQEVRRVLKPGGRLVLCNSKGYAVFEKFFYSSWWGYRVLRRILALLLRCKVRDIPMEREKVIRYLGVDPRYNRNFTEDETLGFLDRSGFRRISCSYHFRKKVSDLLGLLLILRITLGLSRYPKALNWDYWFLFPVFSFLEWVDREPGSGVVYTAMK